MGNQSGNGKKPINAKTIMQEKNEQEKNRGKREHQKDGQVHIVSESLVNEDRDKRREGNNEGRDSENARGAIGGIAEVGGKVSGQPENDRGSHDTR